MLQPAVRNAIDSYLSMLLERGLNWYPAHVVPQDMRASEVDEEEGLVAWKPVPASFDKTDIAKLEAAIDAPLSHQFLGLLSYKHFLELHLGDMWLFAHPSRGWQDALYDQVFRGHPRELLFDKGFLPFAGWSDWGLYCFCLHEKNASGEYAVYQWDHDDPKEFVFIAHDFEGAVSAAMAHAG